MEHHCSYYAYSLWHDNLSRPIMCAKKQEMKTIQAKELLVRNLKMAKRRQLLKTLWSILLISSFLSLSTASIWRITCKQPDGRSPTPSASRSPTSDIVDWTTRDFSGFRRNRSNWTRLKSSRVTFTVECSPLTLKRLDLKSGKKLIVVTGFW